MDSKIFLQSHRSKKSSNTSSGLNIQFKGRRKLLPLNDVVESVSQYEQYIEERKACSKIRLTCQVNPICTNVLFNCVTEIVRNEGGDDVEVLNYQDIDANIDPNSLSISGNKPTRIDFWCRSDWTSSTVTLDGTPYGKHVTNAIRDTQLSNEDNGFIYHCGIDIMNNHLIRSNTFKTVCKENSKSHLFNTIGDSMRNVNGKVINETLYFPDGIAPKNISSHIYRVDDILSFDEAKKTRLIKKYNGWIGFNNRSKIKSYSDFKKGDIMDIERPIMYKNGGDFVDMYPDRSLYSFVPKFNSKRKRIEKNWDYYITYPSSSTTDGFDEFIDKSLNSIKSLYFDENTSGDNGGSQFVIYGIIKHGLRVGDFVNIYKTYFDTVDGKRVEKNEMFMYSAEVSNVVDDYIFIVRGNSTLISDSWYTLSDKEINKPKLEITYDGHRYKIDSSKKFFTCNDDSTRKFFVINNKYVCFDFDLKNVSFKKVVNGIECDYYVRIFSKLPNFKNASSITSSEYDIYKNNCEAIRTYQGDEYNFENHISRLAFAKNIYGDDIGEVVFTDDIDISKIKDNLGRPITSLYLIFFKSNQGYKEWYGFDGKNINPSSENVTYSHCFGKLTCGYETSEESKYVGREINSIFQINNIGDTNGIDVCNINESGNTNCNSYYSKTEIIYGKHKNFYGDICCYNGYYGVEEIIQPIMYRFNTAQRESSISKSSVYFSKYNYDEIIYDDYDTTENFTITTKTVNNVNSKKEGYYYNPSYEIKIKTLGKLKSVSPDFLTIREIAYYPDEKVYSFITSTYHYLGVGDKAMIYDSAQDKYYRLVTVKNKDSNYKKFFCKVYDENGLKETNIDYIDNDGGSKVLTNSKDDKVNGFYLSDFKLFKIDNLDIPSYARILKDGTCRYIWRDVEQNGFSSTSSSVEEYPFTNGALYINKKIDIYVRRQDPYAEWGLYDNSDISGDESYTDIITEDNYIKSDDIKC